MPYAERKMPLRPLPCPPPPLKMRDSIHPALYQHVRDDLTVEPRTWLVTGVAGFIGSNLLEQLLMAPSIVYAAASTHRARLKHPPKTTGEYLETLERQSLTQFVAVLRPYAARL